MEDFTPVPGRRVRAGMTTQASPTGHGRLWIVLMVTPSGYVEVVEVRAPNEATALDTVRYWKPCHQVATDPPGNPLIWDSPGPRP